MAEKQIPWSKLHEIADALGGKLVHITCVDHTGRDYKRIVIEYEEKK
jgi:5,10-methylenetetrahydrofolate reductase